MEDPINRLQSEIDADNRQPCPDFMTGEANFVSFAHLNGEFESQKRKAQYISTSEDQYSQAVSDLAAMKEYYFNILNQINNE